MKHSLLLCTIAALSALATPSLYAQGGDAPAVDVNQLLQELKKIREQNDAGVKARKNQALQQIMAAASSPERAVAFWKEAVRNAQFEGAEKEGQKLADWRDGDGEALSDKLCMGAVQLHLRWLAITLQRANGVEMRVLLPQVIEYTKALQTDEAAADHFADQLDKAKERNESGKHGMKPKGVAEDAVVKRVHDQVMRMAVGGSPVARWLQLSDLLGDAGKKQKGGGGSWEPVPGNLEGIYNAIILPEFRLTKDPRLLDYWEVFIKREGEKAAEHKLDVDQRDWSQVKLPSLRWSRAQDVLLLGYRNRAILEMFNLVKSFPQHPEVPSWISQLEGVLVPGTAPYGSAANVTPSAPGVTGSVPAPVAVPPATATGAVPTATLIPAPSTPTAPPGIRR
jgi:hypothetical protein